MQRSARRLNGRHRLGALLLGRHGLDAGGGLRREAVGGAGLVGAEHGRLQRRPGRLDGSAGRGLRVGGLVGGGRRRLAPGALRTGHQQDVVLVVEAVRLVDEVERRARGGGPGVTGGAGRSGGGRGESGRAERGARCGDARCRDTLHGHGLGRHSVGRDAVGGYALRREDGGAGRDRTGNADPGHTGEGAVQRDALYGCDSRDALRAAEPVGPGEQVLRQSLVRDVAAIGHVKAPSRPLPRPRRHDHRPQRPSARAGPAPARPSITHGRRAEALRPKSFRRAAAPRPARHPGGAARHLRQRQAGATGTTAPDPTAFSRSGGRPVELPTLRTPSVCAMSERHRTRPDRAGCRTPQPSRTPHYRPGEAASRIGVRMRPGSPSGRAVRRVRAHGPTGGHGGRTRPEGPGTRGSAPAPTGITTRRHRVFTVSARPRAGRCPGRPCRGAGRVRRRRPRRAGAAARTGAARRRRGSRRRR